jgi:FAD/FMN-containing dehydrogenase
MTDLKQNIQAIFKGELDDNEETTTFYSHDASLFELKPQLVTYPTDANDVAALVTYVQANKAAHPELSLTARSAGTDMSGGAINESIVMDMTKHFNGITSITTEEAHMQPGLHFRDFDKETEKLNVLLPCYPASRDLCTVGGMVANNSGGEKSLEYGKTEDFVTELQVVFADGNTYTVKPLSKEELDVKISQGDFEGELYRKTFELVESHYDAIKAAKPQVTKNSMGYNLWDVWDRETGIFDLCKLIVGSQGTLGIVTDIKVRLVERRPYSGLLVCFMKDIDNLGDVINATLAHKPATFESFDDNTLWLSIKFFFFFHKTLGWFGLIKLGLSLLPDLFLLMKGIPKLILMAEFNGSTQKEVDDKIAALRAALKPFGMAMETDETIQKSNKFWTLRRESFNLLRKKVKDKHTAPFIDDLVVAPKYLPDFLPELRVIIKKYKLLATIAGHMGDGNFHIIPLMKIEDPNERAKLEPCMREVNELVLKYKGSLSGEHNDGMVRGPWLEQMYGQEIYNYFKDVKRIFDEQNIFNPHKKSDADWNFSMGHIRENFNQ